MDTLNETAGRLLSRIAMRERAAFDALYELAAPKLFGACIRILKDNADAEEALQEVFIRIWQKADRHGPSGAPAMAWLMTLARNLAIDKLRTRKAPAKDIDEAYDIADVGPTPEAATLASDERRRIDGCLDELDAAKAEAVRGAYLEGYSYAELAERFSTPINTMRTHLRRSLIKLRECLER